MSAAPSPLPDRQRPPRIRLLGGEVDAMTPAAVIAFTQASVAARRSVVIANHNLHSLYWLRREPEMAAFYAMADLIEADSRPLIAWGRLLGRPIEARHRATYLDWREAFWRAAQAGGWRVFHLGGAPGVADRAAQALQQRWPGVEIGARHGYFDLADAAQTDEVVETIAAFAPDVLFVGMGMPRQELWVARHRASLPPCAIFTVGAAFDYEAGVTPTPPRWSGRLGLEWLFRFAVEPKRLFARYFIEPWSLIGPALADLTQRREDHPQRERFSAPRLRP
jgi:N-acetylglucosaminyldiphosphoundecaprenol N-acetyl-beta-D-mannosaminyltransferase